MRTLGDPRQRGPRTAASGPGAALVRSAAIIAVVALTSLAFVIAPAGAGRATGNILVFCGYDHSSPNDPIVYPGKAGASHSHDFFGSKRIDAHTTAETLRANPTTCRFKGDRSGYWVPSLRGRSGHLVPPVGMRAYYRGNGRHHTELRRFPAGTKHVQGDARNTNPSGYAAIYQCISGANGGTAYIPESCANNSGFEASYYFPFCSTGETDNLTHKTLVGRTIPCASPQLSVLQIQMIVTYPPEAVGGRLVSDEPMGTKGGLTSHADFFDGWDPAALDMVLDRCVRANVECRSRPDGNVYAGGTEQVIIRAGAIDSPSPRRRAKTACGQTASPVSPPTRMSPAPAASHPAPRAMSLDAVVRSLQRSDPRRLARRRQVPHPLWFAGAGRVTLSWRLSGSAARALGMRNPSKGLVIGKGSLARHAEGCGRVQLRLTAAGQRALGQARRVRISVKASFSSVAGGRSTTSERAFTIKRR